MLCQALPASLFGDFSLAASGLHASPLRGMQSPLGAFRSPPGRSRMGKMTASVGSPAPSFGGSLLGRFGAAATESPSKLPMTAFGNAGDGFSQLEMDVGSLLGLGAGVPRSLAECCSSDPRCRRRRFGEAQTPADIVCFTLPALAYMVQGFMNSCVQIHVRCSHIAVCLKRLTCGLTSTQLRFWRQAGRTLPGMRRPIPRTARRAPSVHQRQTVV